MSDIVFDSGLLLAIGVAAAAGFMRGFVGVGSGMLMAPVFAIIFGPVETVGIVILLEIVVTAQLLPSVYPLIDWRLIISIGAAAAVFMPLGGWLLTTVDAELMARGIALVVLLFVILLLAEWRYHGRRRLPTSLAVGALSGTLMAATSLGNPPVILYLLAGADNAATNRANFTGYFAITLLTLLVIMLWRGLITRPVVMQTAVLLPLFVVGAWIGAKYFARASDRLYRRVALGLLFCVALFGLLR